ncbi:MAG: T9SS type A sorting domain-containing protein [Chitinispirillia bacterium]|jgi:pectate lyase
MKVSRYSKSILLFGFLIGIASTLYAQEKQLAFPSAEGYGKYTKGGTGGKVYEVTTTGSGSGSLHAALKAPGPRTIVFRVSGTISGIGSIPSGTTIAGQTAPGDGICLKGGIGLSSNVIVRYIRVRGASGDNIGATNKSDIIIDHVSTSWCTDESVSIYHCKNVTIQWCMITESLNPNNHAFGGIWGGPNNTYHHNLFAHHNNRNPRFSGGIANNDFRNNVIYNWQVNSVYGGEGKQRGGGQAGYSYVNLVANYYKSGPATSPEMVKYRILDPWKNEGGYGKFYITDNFVYGYPEVTADNWDGGELGGVQVTGNGRPNLINGKPNLINDRSMRTDKPAPFDPIKQQTAEDAFESVMQHVGCSFPKRDDLDKRIIEEVITGTAKYGNNGIINSSNESNGYGTLKSIIPPVDSDHDGMPDEWEKVNGLNPNDPEDRNTKGEGGFTNLVLYLESLVAKNNTVVLSKETKQHHYNLFHIHPNPSNSSFTIKYAIPAELKVKLEVFNFAGKQTAILVNGIKEAGTYFVEFDGAHLGTGLYIYRLTAANKSFARKMFIAGKN